MARLAREGSGSGDEFSVLIKETKAKRTLKPPQEAHRPIRRLKATSSARKPPAVASGIAGTPVSVSRRRKIGVLKENPLMKKWNSKEGRTFEIENLSDDAPAKTPSRPRAQKAQILKALEERSKETEESDDDDDDDKFVDSDLDRYEKPIKAPRRAQPRRAAAAKTIVVESSDDDGLSESEGDSDDGAGMDTKEEESNNDTYTLNEALEHASSSVGLSEHNPNAYQLSEAQPLSDEEDLDRQLQEQLEEEISLVAEREEAEKQKSAARESNSSGLSDTFEDANETLEEDRGVASEDAKRVEVFKLATSSKTDISTTPYTRQKLSKEERNDGKDENDNEDEDDLDDSDSDEEEQDEDSDFVEEASGSELERNTAPGPRSRSLRSPKTYGRGRFALQARGGNASPPQTHKAYLNDLKSIKAQNQSLKDEFQVFHMSVSHSYLPGTQKNSQHYRKLTVLAASMT